MIMHAWLVCVYIAITACLDTTSNRFLSVWYVTSLSMEYAVRIEPCGLSPGAPAKAIIMRFNPASENYDFVKEIQLANDGRPAATLITNDGRFLITIGNIFGRNPIESCLAMYEAASGKHKVIALTDLFEGDELPDAIASSAGRFAEVVPMWGIHWFEREGVLLDEGNGKVIITGIVTGRNHEEDILPPVVTLDLESMTAKRSELNGWHLKWHQSLGRIDQLERAITDSLGLEGELALEHLSVIGQLPIEELTRVENDLLFQLSAGDRLQRAKLSRFEYSVDQRSLLKRGVWNLRNPVAPARWMVSDCGRYLVTFDEYDALGLSANCVVIYDLDSDESRAFSLTDFISDADLKELYSIENLIMWRARDGLAWIEFQGASFRQYTSPCPGLLPHIVIDVRDMQVRLAEPFHSKHKPLRAPGK